jgi:hypothetical protein
MSGGAMVRGVGERAGPESPRQESGMSRDVTVRGVYESGMPRVAGAVAVIWQLALLVQVLAYLRDFRQPAVPVAVWLGMLAAAAWLVPRARRGGLTGQEAAVAVAVAAVAVLLVGLERRAQGATGSVDWSVVGTGWLLALVAASRPAWEWICGAIAVFAIHAAVAIRVFGVETLGLARLAVTAYTLIVIFVAFAAVRPMFRASARITARRAELASRSAAERAATAAILRDRSRRLAVLEREVLPLLRSIADGRAYPAEHAVRAQCERSAAVLRHALADGAGAGAQLLTELEPVLRAAGGRGLPVETQVVGDPGAAGPQVVRATATVLEQTLQALPPQPLLLTVLAAADEIELYLTFRGLCPPAAGAVDLGAAPPGSGWTAAIDVDDAARGCLEVRWPKPAPSLVAP